MQKERDPVLLFTGWHQIKGAHGDLVNRHRILCIGLQITKRKTMKATHFFKFCHFLIITMNWKCQCSSYSLFSSYWLFWFHSKWQKIYNFLLGSLIASNINRNFILIPTAHGTRTMTLIIPHCVWKMPYDFDKNLWLKIMHEKYAPEKCIHLC